MIKYACKGWILCRVKWSLSLGTVPEFPLHTEFSVWKLGQGWLSFVSCWWFREWQIHVLKRHHFALGKHCVHRLEYCAPWCRTPRASMISETGDSLLGSEHWQRTVAVLLKRQLLCNVVISRGPALFAICMYSVTESPWWQEFVGYRGSKLEYSKTTKKQRLGMTSQVTSLFCGYSNSIPPVVRTGFTWCKTATKYDFQNALCLKISKLSFNDYIKHPKKPSKTYSNVAKAPQAASRHSIRRSWQNDRSRESLSFPCF